MNRLHRLFGRRPRTNPEEYERVRCDACDGTGLGEVDELRLGQGFQRMAAQESCWKCHGKGWLLVKKTV